MCRIFTWGSGVNFLRVLIYILRRKHLLGPSYELWFLAYDYWISYIFLLCTLLKKNMLISYPQQQLVYCKIDDASTFLLYGNGCHLHPNEGELQWGYLTSGFIFISQWISKNIMKMGITRILTSKPRRSLQKEFCFLKVHRAWNISFIACSTS